MCDFDEFGNPLIDDDSTPTLAENRARRYARENAIRANHEIAPVADDGLGSEFESEPFRNMAQRDREREEQEVEWERDRGTK
jgi:hypothetical protein